MLLFLYLFGMQAAVQAFRSRHPFRRSLGRFYYRNKRRLRQFGESILGSKTYAQNFNEETLPHTWFQHQSLLLRPLKGVDMRLQHNKITNLRLAIAPLNGLIVKPGETLSLWRQIGKPTTKRGYLPGLILNQGQISEGVGGGLCQLGNLLYWMALHSPLHITERHRHSFDAFPDVNRSIPFGCGATLAYNYIDLELYNPGPHEVQLGLHIGDTHLHGCFRSHVALEETYRVEETHHEIRQQWHGAYTRHNRIERVICDLDGNEKRREFVTENHAFMVYNPLLEGPQE
jgi:vancomycin resistance protein VanW